MDKRDVQRIQDEIVAAVLPQVVFDGWSWDAVVRAASEAGHSEHIARAVFPGRIVDVLDGFSDLADRTMMEALGAVDPEDMRVRDRVRSGVLARFEYLQPHKEAVRHSLAFWAVPTRKPRAAKIVWRTADRIWAWAGDQSTDYNRYTKRGLLSGVLVSTTLAWLGDESGSMDRTAAFLDRRIENVMQLGKVVGTIRKAS